MVRHITKIDSILPIFQFESDHGVPPFGIFGLSVMGKNAFDGVSGTIKRLARRASLQLSLILTPLDLYIWTVDKIPGIEFVYASKDIIAADAERLSNRLNSLAITGTQKYHFTNQFQMEVRERTLCYLVLLSKIAI